jgi:hypothetical protein
MQINNIIITNTNTFLSAKYDYEYVKNHDINNGGYEDIYCHYFITYDGKIIRGCDLKFSAGSKHKPFNKNIIIKYVGMASNKEKFNTITSNQVIAIYSIFYNLYKQGVNFNKIRVYVPKYINTVTGENPFENTFCNNDIVELFEMCDNSINKYREIKEEIQSADNEAQSLIDRNIIKNIQDVHNSKYYKTYKFGIEKYNNILKKHNNIEECIRVSNENIDCNVPMGHSKYIICKDIYDFTHSFPLLKPQYLFNTIFFENRLLKYTRGNYYTYFNHERYIHIIKLFNCWSIIKKTYPSSKTTRVIKKYKNNDNLNKEELKEYLRAYILLSWEVKTIKDYNKEDLIQHIYNEIVSGTYICGQNYVCDDFQINVRNALLYYYRNLQILDDDKKDN